MELTLAEAKTISEACQKKAKEMGIPMTIAVVDAGANVVLLERMDGAMLASISIAEDKAYTAAATKFETGQLASIAQPGQIAYGLAGADHGRMIVFAGGIPLKVKDAVVGAVGVSGGLANQDHEVAQAGVDAFGKTKR